MKKTKELSKDNNESPLYCRTEIALIIFHISLMYILDEFYLIMV